MRRRRLLAALGVLVAVAWIGLILYRTSQGSGLKPITWSPDVQGLLVGQVCPSFPCETAQVAEALATWHDHGAPSVPVEVTDCEGPLQAGTVRFELLAMDERGPDGTTSRYGQPVRSAVVDMKWCDEELLLHETGHLWLTHSTRGANIMRARPEDRGPHWTEIEAALRSAAE